MIWIGYALLLHQRWIQSRLCIGTLNWILNICNVCLRLKVGPMIVQTKWVSIDRQTEKPKRTERKWKWSIPDSILIAKCKVFLWNISCFFHLEIGDSVKENFDQISCFRFKWTRVSRFEIFDNVVFEQYIQFQTIQTHRTDCLKIWNNNNNAPMLNVS